MKPCEHCVYIRFSMFLVLFGSIFALAKTQILKNIAFILILWGIFLGFKHSIILNKIYTALQNENLFSGLPSCKEDPSFPFNIALNEYFPNFFKPSGSCGIDYPMPNEDQLLALSSFQKFFIGDNGLYSKGWYLLPKYEIINMPQACLILFTLFSFLLFTDIVKNGIGNRSALFIICSLVALIILE